MFFTLEEGSGVKRFKAIFFDLNGTRKKTTQFGDKRYENYTIHKDEKRRQNYRNRHKNDRLNDPFSSGALSWYLLWNEPTLEKSIRNYEKTFGMKFFKG
jgi:hypothetical protein